MLSIDDLKFESKISYITIGEKLDGTKVKLFQCDTINLPDNIQLYLDKYGNEFKEIKTFRIQTQSKVSEVYV